MLSQNSPALKTMNDMMEYIGQDPAEQRRYLSHMLLKCDIVTLNEFNLKKGEKIGYQKAAKEIAKIEAEISKAKAETDKAKVETSKAKAETNKAKEKNKKIIQKMLQKGYKIEEISELTGASIKEIEAYNP